MHHPVVSSQTGCFISSSHFTSNHSLSVWLSRSPQQLSAQKWMFTKKIENFILLPKFKSLIRRTMMHFQKHLYTNILWFCKNIFKDWDILIQCGVFRDSLKSKEHRAGRASQPVVREISTGGTAKKHTYCLMGF